MTAERQSFVDLLMRRAVEKFCALYGLGGVKRARLVFDGRTLTLQCTVDALMPIAFHHKVIL